MLPRRWQVQILVRPILMLLYHFVPLPLERNKTFLCHCMTCSAMQWGNQTAAATHANMELHEVLHALRTAGLEVDPNVAQKTRLEQLQTAISERETKWSAVTDLQRCVWEEQAARLTMQVCTVVATCTILISATPWTTPACFTDDACPPRGSACSASAIAPHPIPRLSALHVSTDTTASQRTSSSGHTAPRSIGCLQPGGMPPQKAITKSQTYSIFMLDPLVPAFMELTCCGQ